MIFEVLISTMNRKDLTFLNPIFANNNINDFHILIVNQTRSNTILKSNEKHIRVINSYEFGLSKSRNIAIENAIGDVCLIADDDVQFVKGFDKIIKKTFLKFPDASIIKFKIDTFGPTKFKRYPSSSKRLLSRKDISGISSIEIAFKRRDIVRNKIYFNENFGLGTDFPSGEEYLFLRKALIKKLHMRFENFFIVRHSLDFSTNNMGSDKFIRTKAALYFIDYKEFAYLLLVKFILFLLIKKSIKISQFVDKFETGLHGIRHYKTLIST
ncbi:glycosyltransferase family A protein [Gaetbulibacter aestuarii]|uniref:Glycosyltransferase family A protein n=1 Tax=Gaetbulibacter aestuarii TaxID=1502358 RepID=A0ABW7N1K3_9FLAO